MQLRPVCVTKSGNSLIELTAIECDLLRFRQLHLGLEAGSPAASSVLSAKQRPVAGRIQKTTLAQTDPLDNVPRTNLTPTDTTELAVLQQDLRKAQ